MDGNTDFPRAGLVTNAKVIKVLEDSYKVKLMPEKCPAVLPFAHLSDYADISELWKLALSKGDFVQKVTLFQKHGKGTVSMKESIVSAAEEKLFAESFDDLKEGMLLPGVVKNHQDFGFFVELAGGHTGLCPATSLPSIRKPDLKYHYPEGRSVLAYVKQLGNVKGRFLVSVAKQDCRDDPVKSLTNFLQSRDEAFKMIAEKNGKLKNYIDVAVGSIVDITVKSIKKNTVVCETSSGLQATVTNNHIGNVEPKIGEEYPAVVLDVDVTTPSLLVTLDPTLCKAVKARGSNPPSELKTGQTLNGEILLRKQGFLLMKLKSSGCDQLLYVPAKEHFNDHKPASSYKIGMCSNVVIIKKVNGSVIGVLDKEGDGDIQVGDVVEAVVKHIDTLEMSIVARGIEGRVHVTEVSDNVEEGKNPLQEYKDGMKLKVKVISKKTITEESNDFATPFLECSLKESKMDKTNPDELLSEELLTSRGAGMMVFITSVDNSKISVQASLMHFGYVSMFNVSKDMKVINEASKHFKVGQALKANVIGKTHEDQIVFSLVGREDIEPEVGMSVTVIITDVNKTKPLISLRLPNGLKGVAEKPKVPSPDCTTGKYVRCEVLSVSKSGLYKLSLLQSKRKASAMTEDAETSESEKEMVPASKKSKTITDDKDTSVRPFKSKRPQNRLNVVGFAWGGELHVQPSKKVASDDEDDDDEDDDVKMKPFGAASKSKKKEREQEEKMIDEYEKQQLRGNTGPQNVNDFERLVLQSPNSSMVWLGYMAYHMEMGEVAKARTVAEKALETIGYREEQEKKNVWLAYLNLEVMYGETEDLKKLLQRAIAYNDPFDIQLKMADIYIGANKIEDAEMQFQVLIRKFKKEKSVWKSYAQFLYTQNKHADARNILKKCLITLEKRDHVEVITRFACLEFSHGNPERGRTLFENLIASYPQRTDIWSVYVDIVVKSGDITGARQLLERAVQQKLNAKKVSFLIKKFIRFEETHGTEDRVHKVKDMAVSIFKSEK